MATILVLYYSRNGTTRELARHICRGVDSVAGAQAMLRTVPAVTSTVQQPAAAVPDDGPPYVTPAEWAAARWGAGVGARGPPDGRCRPGGLAWRVGGAPPAGVCWDPRQV